MSTFQPPAFRNPPAVGNEEPETVPENSEVTHLVDNQRS